MKKKGVRTQPKNGSAGGEPRHEVSPPVKTRERPDEPEGSAQGRAVRRDLSRRRNTPRRPRGRSGRPEHRDARSLDGSPEGVVDEHKDGILVQPFSCSGATSGIGTPSYRLMGNQVGGENAIDNLGKGDLMRAQLGKRVRPKLGLVF